jgi:preprotein translocase subunit SecG
MLLGLLLTLNIMVCLALIGVVLLQRSEGGVLGSGSPTGLITTRGAGDLLTRTTWVLFTLFLTISLALTLLGGRERSSQAILNRLKSQSVNPDTLPTKSKLPAGPPGQATPPPVQVPSTGASRGLGAPTPSVRIPSSNPSTPSAALPMTGPPLPVVSLPPLGSSNTPRPAAPAKNPAP